MSVRLGRRGLARLHERLSERDIAVIHSVASHRFLTGSQLQRLHFTDHATAETSARVARSVLARLTEQRILGRLRRRVGGVRAGSASYVYRLGPVGRRLIGEQSARRVSEPSSTFLEHTLAVADAHLALREAAAAGRFELSVVELEPLSWRRYLNAAGVAEVLRPDLAVVTAEERFEHFWFVEVDRGSEHRPALQRKCRAYESYWRSGLEQRRSGTFPRVVWLTPDDERTRRIEQAIASARLTKGELFRVVRFAQLSDLVAGGAQ